ncbi:hypothetical protein, partial [Actinomyces sp.]|uniref:hypothetical protein n=1 Tax=Actinomyces sp. TaxID=29317 RepID=UPI0025BC679E
MSSQYPYRNVPSQPPTPGPPAGSMPGAGSLPGAPSGAPKRGALRRLAPYSIIAIPAAFVATYVIMSNMDAY